MPRPPLCRAAGSLVAVVCENEASRLRKKSDGAHDAPNNLMQRYAVVIFCHHLCHFVKKNVFPAHGMKCDALRLFAPHEIVSLPPFLAQLVPRDIGINHNR
jgi:hypothetical protein